MAEKNGLSATREKLRDANVNSNNIKAEGVSVPGAYDFASVPEVIGKADYAQVVGAGGSRCAKYCSHLKIHWFKKMVSNELVCTL